MSESSAKSSQPLASKGEKDVSEKRGRGRPRKKPQVRGGPYEKGGTGHPQDMGQQETPPHTYVPRLGTPPVQPHCPFEQHLPRTHQQDPPGGLQSTPELLALAGGSPAPPQALLNLPLQTG